MQTQTIILVIIAALVFLKFYWKRPASNGAASASGEPAKETYSTLDSYSASLMAGQLSNIDKDKPWIPQKPITPIEAGGLNNVGWPEFQVNLPRLEDRQF